MYTDTHILVERKMSVMGTLSNKIPASLDVLFFYKGLITEIMMYNDNVN